ncbi:MAG: hypothetical protein HWQ41_18040 [Nostoc sp. NOS(2021)]|uniref:hypothetical protein n=1 Tax=Nostoc sp. NOS(2021) TaxID=2815407 RepID=UPI0025F9E64B|nr:hypothetical protein [Nostoc sp. NOS(2021)]MBN3897102.1 hypothetical protein [Nostoc sp. NOS(2021)]
MSGFSLQAVFGANAIQDGSTITLWKQDLTDNAGLTFAEEIDGEAVLAAVVIQAAALGLDTTHRDGDDDEIDPNGDQQVAINPPATGVVPRVDGEGNVTFFKRDSIAIDFDVSLSNFNANDY